MAWCQQGHLAKPQEWLSYLWYCQQNTQIMQECSIVNHHICSTFIKALNMMTSSNGNIFRVTGHLCRELTSHRWIPCKKARDAELWCFLWSVPQETVEQTMEIPVILDAIAFFMASLVVLHPWMAEYLSTFRAWRIKNFYVPDFQKLCIFLICLSVWYKTKVGSQNFGH